jgi:hypothetical protein
MLGGEEYTVRFDLGVRWSGGAPSPHLRSSGAPFFYLEEADSGPRDDVAKAVPRLCSEISVPGGQRRGLV